MQALEQLVLESGLDGRARLPPERELAASFGVSRTTVRAAIQRLVSRRVLETRRGSGVFVVGGPPARVAPPWITAPWTQLIDEHPPLRADTLEFRLVFECAAARFAAERATARERTALRAAIGSMADAVRRGDVAAEAAADAEFHAALAAASHNLMMGRFYVNAIATLRQHITRNTYDAAQDGAQAGTRARARLQQHERICEAICRQSPDDAAAAMQAHIEFVGRQFQAG